jgi:hypothetical protein
MQNPTTQQANERVSSYIFRSVPRHDPMQVHLVAGVLRTSLGSDLSDDELADLVLAAAGAPVPKSGELPV